jgi:hypothetical protein
VELLALRQRVRLAALSRLSTLLALATPSSADEHGWMALATRSLACTAARWTGDCPIKGVSDPV